MEQPNIPLVYIRPMDCKHCSQEFLHCIPSNLTAISCPHCGFVNECPSNPVCYKCSFYEHLEDETISHDNWCRGIPNPKIKHVSDLFDPEIGELIQKRKEELCKRAILAKDQES